MLPHCWLDDRKRICAVKYLALWGPKTCRRPSLTWSNLEVMLKNRNYCCSSSSSSSGIGISSSCAPRRSIVKALDFDPANLVHPDEADDSWWLWEGHPGKICSPQSEKSHFTDVLHRNDKQSNGAVERRSNFSRIVVITTR